MGETNILKEFSVYLQQMAVELEREDFKNTTDVAEVILSYDQFKAYYISTLVGKDDFLDKLVREVQFSAA